MTLVIVIVLVIVLVIVVSWLLGADPRPRGLALLVIRRQPPSMVYIMLYDAIL